MRAVARIESISRGVTSSLDGTPTIASVLNAADWRRRVSSATRVEVRVRGMAACVAVAFLAFVVASLVVGSLPLAMKRLAAESAQAPAFERSG